MSSVLRLVTLSYAIARVDASLLFWSDRDAGYWGPAKETAGISEIDPEGWTPKPTAPPGAKPFDHDLRRRQQTIASTSATCGFPVDNISEAAITCSDGGYCLKRGDVAGCCTEQNTRDCRLPTTCIEASQLQSSSSTNIRALTCDDPERPRCVTYFYDANFFEYLHGVSFLACGEAAQSSTIATSPPLGWSPTSDTTTSSATSSTTTNPVTVTITPGDSPSSSTTSAPASGSSGVSRTGAIVGGVLGGVAGLALIVAAILLCLRYRKRRRIEGKEMEGSPPYPGRDYAAANVYPSGLPEPQYQSDFYGELPPQMAQSSTQHMTSYPPPMSYEPVAVPRETHQPRRPSTFVPGSPKPNEDDIVSPITPGDQLNPADDPATYTWISNPTPPPQSEYSQYSPPPPPQFQTYRPYPGT